MHRGVLVARVARSRCVTPPAMVPVRRAHVPREVWQVLAVLRGRNGGSDREAGRGRAPPGQHAAVRDGGRPPWSVVEGIESLSASPDALPAAATSVWWDGIGSDDSSDKVGDDGRVGLPAWSEVAESLLARRRSTFLLNQERIETHGYLGSRAHGAATDRLGAVTPGCACVLEYEASRNTAHMLAPFVF